MKALSLFRIRLVLIKQRVLETPTFRLLFGSLLTAFRIIRLRSNQSSVYYKTTLKYCHQL